MKKMIEQLYQHYLAHPVITTDSRNCPEGSIFFALKGERFDGNKFAVEVLEKGCSLAVVDDIEAVQQTLLEEGKQEWIQERLFVVPDVLAALQQLAAYHRQQFKTWTKPVTVIGITGTNGKTTTKELLNAVLSQKYNVLATAGNLNNQIGVPLTLLKVTQQHELAIIEMGANHPMDIAELCEIARPDYGLITNVGKAHLLGFGSLDGVIAAKTKLYESLKLTGGKVFIDADNQYLFPKTDGMERIPYLKGKMTDCSPFLEMTLEIGGESIDIHSHLIGNYNLINIVAAATVGNTFSVSPSQIKNAIEGYEPQNMRSQLIDLGYDRKIILDAYNANPTSMMAALQSFNLNTAQHKSLILGDMRELGDESQREHLNILRYLLREDVTFGNILLVGDEFVKAFNELFEENIDSCNLPSIRCYSNVENLIADSAAMNNLPGTILIKGSRGIRLELAAKALQESADKTQQK